MRNSLKIAAAVLALVAGSADISTARAQGLDCSGVCVSQPSTLLGPVAGVAFGAFLVKLVVDDVRAGGLSRKVAAVVPGAGYATTLEARLQNSPELRQQVAGWHRIEQHAAIASAAR